MTRDELRKAGERTLAEARAVRAAFPDAAAMLGVPLGPAPEGPTGDEESAALLEAIRYLRDETELVRRGGEDTMYVLDDEAANVERLMRCPLCRRGEPPL